MTGDGPAGTSGGPPGGGIRVEPLQPSGAVVLRTARLDMRPLTRAYLPHMLALYEDPRVTEFLVDLDEAGHVRRLAETERMWASRGLGRVAIHERGTGRFVGRGGLHHWEQFGEVEVGWALRTAAWGRGYATESARGWLDWGLANLDVSYLTAYVAPDNAASRSVAERAGMSVLRRDTFHGRTVLVYALHRVEAEQAGTRLGGRDCRAVDLEPEGAGTVTDHPGVPADVRRGGVPAHPTTTAGSAGPPTGRTR